MRRIANVFCASTNHAAVIDEGEVRQAFPGDSLGSTSAAVQERALASRRVLNPAAPASQRATSSAPAAASQFKRKLDDWVSAASQYRRPHYKKLASQIAWAYKWRSAELKIYNPEVHTLPDCLYELTSLKSLMLNVERVAVLPELPPGLRELTVWGNRESDELQSLPELPQGLHSLHISDCCLPDLQALPPKLRHINAHRNNFTTLPPLPSTLDTLHVHSNLLTALPDLPPGLKHLNACCNQLRQLPVLPDGLMTLHVAENLLTELQDLPPGLKELAVSRNQISVLPELPKGLTEFLAGFNHLHRLPPLPDAIKTMFIGGNPLRNLPKLSYHLESLFAAECGLTVLPDLPKKLQLLHVEDNQLSTVPALPKTLRTLNLDGNAFDSPDQGEMRAFTQREYIAKVRGWLQQNPHLVTPPEPPFYARGVAGSRSTFANTSTVLVDIANDARHGTSGAGPSNAAVESTCPDIPPDFVVAGINEADVEQAYLLQQQFDGLPFSTLTGQSGTSQPAAASSVALLSAHAAAQRDSVAQGWVAFIEAHAIGNEPGAPAFNRFLERLYGASADVAPAEYSNPISRPSFVQRVNILLEAIKTSPQLRQQCYAIAGEYTTSCGDRVTQGLNDMEMARISHDAESGVYTNAALFALAENMFKIDAVDQLAVKKIADLRARGASIDEIEIRLKYQTELAQRLNLPGISNAMLYPGYAIEVSSADLDAAELHINTQLERSASIEFIAQWKPWRNAMERQHPQDYQRERDHIALWRDPLAQQPVRMSEQEWLEALDRQKTIETEQLHKVTMRLTRAFLEDLPTA